MRTSGATGADVSEQLDMIAVPMKVVGYRFAPDGKEEHVLSHLANARGILQTASRGLKANRVLRPCRAVDGDKGYSKLCELGSNMPPCLPCARLDSGGRTCSLPPQAYLADILDLIHDHKINRFDELLPSNWTPLASASPGRLMTAITQFYMIHEVARMLGEDPEMLEAIVSNDDNLSYGNIVSVHTGTDEAVTGHGIEELQEMTLDARRSPQEWQNFLEDFVSDPDIIARVKDKGPR